MVLLYTFCSVCVFVYVSHIICKVCKHSHLQIKLLFILMSPSPVTPDL